MYIQRAREATENQRLWKRRRHAIAKCLRYSAQRETQGWKPTLKKKKNIKSIDGTIHIEKTSELPKDGSKPALMSVNQYNDQQEDNPKGAVVVEPW